MERPCSNDWPIPIVKCFFLIAPWNLQRLLLCPLLYDHFTVCLWGKRGKSLFLQSCYPPITQLKAAINPLHTHSPGHPFFKLSKPILKPFLVCWVHQLSEHLDTTVLGLLQRVVSLLLETLKTRHSTQDVVSEMLNWEELMRPCLLGFLLERRACSWTVLGWIQKMKGMYLQL